MSGCLYIYIYIHVYVCMYVRACVCAYLSLVQFGSLVSISIYIYLYIWRRLCGVMAKLLDSDLEVSEFILLHSL